MERGQVPDQISVQPLRRRTFLATFLLDTDRSLIQAEREDFLDDGFLAGKMV